MSLKYYLSDYEDEEEEYNDNEETYLEEELEYLVDISSSILEDVMIDECIDEYIEDGYIADTEEEWSKLGQKFIDTLKL
jgi:hypothetical protein